MHVRDDILELELTDVREDVLQLDLVGWCFGLLEGAL